MSDLRRRGGTFLLGTLLAAAVAHGQAARTDSSELAAAKANAIKARDAYQAEIARRGVSQQRERERPIVLRRGNFVIRGDSTWMSPGFKTTLASALTVALDSARTLYGVETDSLLGEMSGGIGPTTVERNVAGRWRTDIPGASIYIGGTNSQVALVRDRPAFSELEHLYLGAISTRAGSRMPPAVARWIRHETISAWNADERETAYRILALHESPVGLSCANGVIAACRAALGIVPGGDTLGAWFDQATRIAMARRAARAFLLNDTVSRRCLHTEDDRACRAVLEYRFGFGPTSSRTRVQLVRIALLRGGPDAFRRLIADTSGDVVAQLERASGMPFDSLVAAWQAETTAGRPPSPRPTWMELASMVVSCAAVAGFVAWRRGP